MLQRVRAGHSRRMRRCSPSPVASINAVSAITTVSAAAHMPILAGSRVAINITAANADGPVEIQVGSDSFDILVTLRYAGNLPSLPDARLKKVMVEEQSFVSGLAGYLSGLHADRIERSAKGEECEIKLLFQM